MLKVTLSFLFTYKLHFLAQTFFFLSWREAPVSHFTDSFTCSPCVLSLVCTLKLHCSVLNLPPDCPNKPRQTGRRQRRDVTHSSEPWRLSAWRRAGGRYGDLKQQALTPAFTCIARKPWEQSGCGDHHSFITLNHSDDITAPRTCKRPLLPVYSRILF